VVAYHKPSITPDLNSSRLSQLEAQMPITSQRSLVVAVVITSVGVVIVALVLVENIVNLAANLVHQTASLGS